MTDENGGNWIEEHPEDRELPLEQHLESRDERRHRPSFLFPLLLIALGVIFLLRNAGVLTGDVWNTLLRLWPLVLIGIGLDNLWQRQGIVGSVFWIGLGIVLLLANLDLLRLNVFQVLLSLWPILLIAIGLDIVIGRRSIWGAVVGLILLAAIIAGAVWLIGSEAGVAAVPIQEISEPLQGASQAVVELRPSVGMLQVSSMMTGDSLVNGTLRSGQGERVEREASLDGTTARFSLVSEGNTVIYPVWRDSSWIWDLLLNPNVPIELLAGMGVGEINLDLSDLQITRLEGNQGVGRIRIVLPAAGNFRGSLSSGIGETVIIVPPGTQVRIQSDTGIAVTNVPDNYNRQDNIYTSPGYETGNEAIDLVVNQAIGRVLVREE